MSKKLVMFICCVIPVVNVWAASTDVIRVEKVYGKYVQTFDEKGNQTGQVEKDKVFNSIVLTDKKHSGGGISNDVGLIKVELVDKSAEVWLKFGHVKTTYVKQACEPITVATADVDNEGPVSSGWEVACEE